MKKKRPKEKKKHRQVLFTKVFLVFLLIGFILSTLKIFAFFKSSRLPKQGRITIGFNSDPCIIASFSPDEKSLSFLLFPSKTLVQAAEGYGQYRLEAFQKLAEVEKKPFFLKESLSLHLSLPINGWVGKTSKPPSRLEPRSLKNWYQKQALLGFQKNRETNLASVDFLKLWLGSFSIPATSLNVFSLEKDWGLNELELADGSRFYEFNLEKTDKIIRDSFSEEKIKSEKLTIGVVNATDHQGLAKRASRLVSNLGGEVIKITDWHQKASFSEIRLKPSQKPSFTSQKLSEVFTCPIKEDDFSPLVDILVIIGEDFWQKLTGAS